MFSSSWQTLPILSPEPLRSWLTNSHSMTTRLIEHFSDFKIEVLHTGLSKIHIDEAKLIGIPPQHLAYTREVFLCNQSEPLIYAHSVTHPRWLKTHYTWLNRQGKHSLGSTLFANPLIQRSPISVAKIGPYHPLYRKIQHHIFWHPPYLWARRSCFLYHQAPLLVTEVFLPNFVEALQTR